MEAVENGAGCGHCLELCYSALLLHHYQLMHDGSLFSGPLGSPPEHPRKMLPDLHLFPSLPYLPRGYCAAGAVSLQPFVPPSETSTLTPPFHQNADLSVNSL